MITKIHTSRNIATTINYVMTPKKRAEVILSEGIFSMRSAENIAREFETQSALRPQAKTKLLHIPMSFHLRDRELMERDGPAIVKEWLRRMEAYGFRFDQYIVVRHHDQDHKNPHFHLVINLTLADGSAVKTSYIGKYAKMASMEVTRKWAMVATDNKTQQATQETAQPKATQPATSESARPATTYTMNNTSSANAPTNSDWTEAAAQSGIAAAMMEMLVQPTIVHTAGGGGGSKEDDEKKNKPRKRFFKR